MPKEKITSSQVAKLAGVSQSAVSRVFTPGASVSEKTADKVRQAAEQLGYRPNVLARSLITGKSRIIGLVVAYLDNHFYPVVLEKLSSALQAEGYHVLVFMAAKTSGNMDTVLEEILDYQVDGIVLASVSMSSDLASRCHAAGVPVVLFNRTQNDDHLSAITSDNVSGGRKVAEHFAACDYQRVGYIAGWAGASTQRDREAGFLQGIEQTGLDLVAREDGDFDFEIAKKAAHKMFSKPDYPEAVFVCNDHMAFAVMDVLRFELNLSIPDDVAVVGFDDVPNASWGAYQLTTVRQAANQMVKETVSVLMSYINEQDISPRRVSLDGPLIIRKTTKPLTESNR